MAVTHQSLVKQVMERVCDSERTVFTNAEFSAIGSCEAVEHALNRLIDDKVLVSIGSGLLAKARRNRITNELMLAAPGGFHQVALEALELLGVAYSPCAAELRYQAGGNQMPVRTSVKVIGNYKPEICFGRHRVVYEE